MYLTLPCKVLDILSNTSLRLLSKEIIELHEGSIIYTSTKGKGTTVDIILPILENY